MCTHTPDCHIPYFIVGIQPFSGHCHSEAPVQDFKRLIHFITPVLFTLGLYISEKVENDQHDQHAFANGTVSFIHIVLYTILQMHKNGHCVLRENWRLI